MQVLVALFSQMSTGDERALKGAGIYRRAQAAQVRRTGVEWSGVE